MIPLMELCDLSKSFGGLQAVNQLTLSIRPGEILGLIGPNGSGKTTTINVVTGIYAASSGKVMLAGRDLTNHKPHQVMRAGMARTFQNLRLFLERSVIDNIRAGQHVRCHSIRTLLSAFPTREERALLHDAHELADRFQLGNRLHTLAGDLSYGEKKRLEIARALASNPRVLLLDEPAAGMNPAELNWLVDSLREIKQSGVAILLVEHHMKLIMSVCDVITVLNFGAKIAEGSPSEVSRNPDVIAAYLGTSPQHA
jgi:branched-chain amino acid transport system ATP-binding protein